MRTILIWPGGMSFGMKTASGACAACASSFFFNSVPILDLARRTDAHPVAGGWRAGAAGAVRAGFLVAVGRGHGRHPARDGGHRAARLPVGDAATGGDGGHWRGRAGRAGGAAGDGVRLSRSPRVRVAAAAAAGHAGVCHGVRVHRLSAVLRPAADLAARHFRAAGAPAARGAQRVGCGLGVFVFALPVCVFAVAHRAGRACAAVDGGRAPAGRLATAPAA